MLNKKNSGYLKLMDHGRWLTSVVVLGLIMSIGLVIVGNAKELVLKFSHVVAAQGHPKGEAVTAFANRVNKEMAGKVRIEVYPNSQLYDDNKVLEAMLLGDVHFAAPSLSKFEKYSKSFRIFDLFFLFDDINAVNRFQLGPDGQKLLGSMQDKGVLGLAFLHNGMKQISAKRPLLNAVDAKGLKFRIQSSDVLAAHFSALDANPQKLAFAEVYGALQTGAVDGQENTWSNIFTRKFFEVQDGVTESNHGILDYLIVTSSTFWNGLPDGIRDQLSTILLEVVKDYNNRSYKINQQNKQKVIDDGGIVRQLSPAQRQTWVDASKPVWKEFEKDIGKDLIDAALRSNQP